MKNLFFAAGIIVCTLLSCSSSKKLNTEAFPKLTDAENYFKSPNAISEQEALAMINGFPKHKTHLARQKHLQDAYVMFDTADLRKVITNSNVDNIKFVFASQSDDKHIKKYPTVIMRIKLKASALTSVNEAQHPSGDTEGIINDKMKGSFSTGQYGETTINDAKFFVNSVQYIKATQYCPPPSGCALTTNE
jgi:hypothetical protein